MTSRIVVGEADASLDQRLSDELDVVNATAAPGPTAVELTVRALDDAGDVIGGISGWTWQQAAGIGMTWVRADQRGTGLGSALIARFEQVAADKWEGVPVDGQADVHFRKDP